MCTQEREPEPDYLAEEAELKRRRIRKYLKWGCLAALVLFLAVYATFQIGVSIWVDRQLQRRGPEAYEDWKTFLRTPVEFPPEYFEPTEVSDALIQKTAVASLKYSEMMKKHPGELQTVIRPVISGLSWSSQTVTEPQWEQARESAGIGAPYILALLDIAEQIDKEFQQSGTPRLSTRRTYLDSDLSIHLLAMKTRILARDGDPAGAVEHGLAALWFLAAFSMSDADSYWYTHGERVPVTIVIRHEIAGIQDIGFLKQTLAELNRLDPCLNRALGDYAWALELNSRFERLSRMGRTKGATLEFVPGKTGAEYVKELVLLEYGPGGLVGSIESFMKLFLGGYRITDRKYRSVYREMLRALEIGGKMEELYFFEDIRGSLNWIAPHEELLAAAMDDLRLEIASRLYKMETDTYPSATTDLVPQYLPEEIVNRETGKSYVWDKSGKWSSF